MWPNWLRRTPSRVICIPAWGGFLTVEDENRINVLFKRAKRYGFTDTVFIVVGSREVREHSDLTLFICITIEITV